MDENWQDILFNIALCMQQYDYAQYCNLLILSAEYHLILLKCLYIFIQNSFKLCSGKD